MEKRRVIADVVFVDDKYTAGPWTFALDSSSDGKLVKCVASLMGSDGVEQVRYTSAWYYKPEQAVLACFEAAFGSTPCHECHGACLVSNVECSTCKGAGEVTRRTI